MCKNQKQKKQHKLHWCFNLLTEKSKQKSTQNYTPTIQLKSIYTAPSRRYEFQFQTQGRTYLQDENDEVYNNAAAEREQISAARFQHLMEDV